MRYKVTMIESYDFEVEADSAEDAKNFMLVGQPWISGRQSAVCGQSRQTGYRRKAYASAFHPPKPSNDEGYMAVLAEMRRYREINMKDAPNLLKDWYGISKLEAMRLFNGWTESLSEEEQLDFFNVT